ncbi:hypothetical protein BD309DRAFT_974685 [Dichomitus squalens]|nr:hypothetical protein BD309DRAFT_974685 [Dichomitus squalens]
MRLSRQRGSSTIPAHMCATRPASNILRAAMAPLLTCARLRVSLSPPITVLFEASLPLPLRARSPPGHLSTP